MNAVSFDPTELPLEPIKIAILAMGGEGGGVLADWIVNLGEGNGYFAQTTSVPGVAQRTGATIYYVELYPGADRPNPRVPVLAQAPLPGDVDIVLASELMEAGRAVQRGFVTSDRTTLIASTHRVYSIAEKSAMGDGRVESDVLRRQVAGSAKACISFDMARLAEQAGSVISAVLFGALSGSGVLPFSRQEFEETIERGGIGVKPSLNAFEAGYRNARDMQAEPTGQTAEMNEAEDSEALHAANPGHSSILALLERVRRFPVKVAIVAQEGVRRLIDYQDVAYAELYLSRLEALAEAPGGTDPELLRETARHLALWMSYEDVIRVAQLKTRGSRFDRVRTEVRCREGQLLDIEEFMHPRLEEICETLPVRIGRWLESPGWANRLLKRLTREGRVVRTSSIRGFVLLRGLAFWGRWRRLTLRHAVENARIERWLARVHELAAHDPALALEAVKCQRLVKGYSDTHERGLKNYETLMAVLDRHQRYLSPVTLREMRDAALADEHGLQLQAYLQRLSIHQQGLSS